MALQNKGSFLAPFTITVKDDIARENKSGIYQVSCNYCEKIYLEGELREETVWILNIKN